MIITWFLYEKYINCDIYEHHVISASYYICIIYIFMYIIILAINCHSFFCLWAVSPCSVDHPYLFLFFFIYVIYVTNHQNHCKSKMQMSVILCSHGLLDWFNKNYSILFYSILNLVLHNISVPFIMLCCFKFSFILVALQCGCLIYMYTVLKPLYIVLK
jgi:hypothetical protein